MLRISTLLSRAATSKLTYQNPRLAVAICGSEPCRSAQGWRILALRGTKSRESIYGSSVRHSAERAAEARKDADRLACVAWNQRMLGSKDRLSPLRPSATL